MATSTRSSRSSRSRSAKKSTITVDFTGVESSGKIQAGRQLGTVLEIEQRTSETSGGEYLNWKIKGKGGNVYHTTSLQPQALWNLRSTLEAMGMEVPEGALEIDPAELVGGELGMEIEHETYQGKKRGVIVDMFPVEELDEEEAGPEEEPEEEENEEGGDDLTFDDVQEMEKDELIELASENEIKLAVKIKKDLAALRNFLCEELGLEEGEAEEEEAGEGVTLEEVNEMDVDELIELAEENNIKLTARQKKRATTLRPVIIEALGLAEEEEEETATSSKTIAKGKTVTFVDDGEELTGKVKSVNKEEGFAVILVDGEEWEVELDDIK